MHYIHEWEEEHDKHIKVIITPHLGEIPVIRTAYTRMLRGPAGHVFARGFRKGGDFEPWNALGQRSARGLAGAGAAPYLDAIENDVREVLESYGFSSSDVVVSQENFADPLNDPDDRYLSTNEAYWNGINAGYDYIVNLPVSFFAENTDTAFGHAMVNYEGFDEYSLYDPIDYPGLERAPGAGIRAGRDAGHL